MRNYSSMQIAEAIALTLENESKMGADENQMKLLEAVFSDFFRIQLNQNTIPTSIDGDNY